VTFRPSQPGVRAAAYKAGIPGNGRPFPGGAMMARIHWGPKKLETFPTATVPGTLHGVDFMVKDSKRFADGRLGIRRVQV
jgi:hypothetical protein